MNNLLALVLCFTLLCLSLFQVALIAGKPWGEYAWGGYHKVLTKKLKIASAFSILIYFFIILIVLNYVGISSLLGESFADTAMKIITGYFFVGIFLNAISRSKKERTVMVPATLILFASSLLLVV